MRFACLTTVVPGATLAEQCETIAGAGCTGVETILFPDTPLERWQEAFHQAAAGAGLRPVCVILGGLALDRPGQLVWVREAMQAVGELGAALLLTPEYRPQEPLPLFPPFVPPNLGDQDRVDNSLHHISDLATATGTPVYLEPLTQFESRYWRDVETVLAVCRRLANPLVGLALDFHNMNITEAQIHVTIRRAGAWIRHIHLADSNRRLPGRGHVDFATGFAALRDAGYEGWYSFECTLDDPIGPNLAAVIGTLRQY